MDRSGTKRSLAIFGGTFNPIHLGHLAIADAALEQAGLEKVVFVPARIPPHKEQTGIIDARTRYKMAELAISGSPHFEISSYELDKETVSYSIETIEAFQERYPGYKIYFIIGSDTVPELRTWYRVERIFKKTDFIVARRPGFEEIDLTLLTKNSKILNGIYPDISSTDIRQRLKKRLPVFDLVPEKTAEFIIAHSLYLE